jgi:putative transposase
LRQELLNHVILLNEKHLEKLLREYIEGYYNTARTHQGINCQTPILSAEPVKTVVVNTVLESQPILNGLYHRYKKVA